MRMRGEIRTDLIDIKSNMHLMSETVTTLVASSMNKFKEKSEGNIARHGETADKPPSFDLGVGSTQPDLSKAVKSKDVEAHVDMIISDVLEETESAEQEIITNKNLIFLHDYRNKTATHIVHISGLPIKRASRPAKALQSPYVVVEGKQTKPSGDVVLLQNYTQHVDDADVADFQNWFQRGYKPHNKKKFSDKDDHACPQFVVGQFPVGCKSW
ncbi:Hypothetical predicted protein [Olea europaea subsp. europaea]|uniref:Uncharacterized protein n=1 Tax=Olea europaea subsp. europaea TaxID=158383 RepID=A0A8S0RLN2_OLEEU|nr:Hypothetical predicted protein [Olea europaea subsp. europaea]